MPLASPALRALRELRNIPDVVLLELLHNLDIEQVVLHGAAPYSFPVFEYLWNNATENYFRQCIVTRPLTLAQRAIVLTSEHCDAVLETLAEHNILTLSELKVLPTSAIMRRLRYLVLDYYENNRAVMDYLFPYLSTTIACCYVMRSAPDQFSDAEVMRHVCGTFCEKELVAGTTGLDQRPVQALQDLLRRRPHLATQITSLPDPRAHLAVASSPLAGRPEVLRALMGVEPAGYNKAGSYYLIKDVCTTLARNPVVPTPARAAVDPESPLSKALLVLPENYAFIDDASHIGLLVDRALASGEIYAEQAKVELDIPALATNSHLSQYDANRLLECWTDRNFGPALWHRVGVGLAQKTYVALCVANKHNIDQELCTRFAGSRGTAKYTESLTPIKLSLDDQLSDSLKSRAGLPKDATTLIQVLTERPIVWQRFLHSLDYAPDSATLRELAATAHRVAAI